MSDRAAQPGSIEAGAESDVLLAQRWQGGDLRAAESLIRRHSPRLHAFLASRALHAHEAEDLAQEVFLAVSRRISTYRSEHPFIAWLYTIARHKVADAWRAHRPTEVFEARHEEADDRTPATLHESAESGAVAWREVFARLPETQASALWLRVQEDLSIESIAAALEVTVANAKVLLFRARQTLSRTWKPSLIS